jgi:hypothetical protein
MIGQYLPNKTKVVLFIGLKFFQHLNVAFAWLPMAHFKRAHTENNAIGGLD